MTTLSLVLDRYTSGWYFAALCALTLIYFGSGVYHRHVSERTAAIAQEEMVQEAKRASEQELLNKARKELSACKPGNACLITSLGMMVYPQMSAKVVKK